MKVFCRIYDTDIENDTDIDIDKGFNIKSLVILKRTTQF